MTTSPAGRKLIKDSEGCRFKAYLDQRGIPSIAYGHTQWVKLGDTCTQTQADAWLTEDLAAAEKAIRTYVSVDLNQNQYDAVASLIYNIGSGSFELSTVRRLLNAGKYAAAQPLTDSRVIIAEMAIEIPDNAADAFLMWRKTNGEDNAGLINRRMAERALFLTASSSASPA